MEIADSTIGIFYLSKILTLAPYSLYRNEKGVLEIRRSLFFTVYTLCLSSIMVFLTYRGLLFDANSKIPVRMKSATSKVVTAMDVSVVVLACVAGTFCGTFSYKSIRELNIRLTKIDESLHSYINFKRDRIRSIILILIPIFTISLLLEIHLYKLRSLTEVLFFICLGLDVGTWLRFAEAMKIDNENTELNVQWYIPFYSLYFILTALHIHFANTAFGISRRYHRLNYMLRNSFLSDKKKEAPQQKQKITTILPNVSSFNTSLAKCATDTASNEGKSKALLLRLTAENHASLSKCIMIVSSSFGIAVLFILVSCLLHLVATSYFLFLELLSKKSNEYVYLQVLWIIFHLSRLLMVVEPCHLATKESYRTIQIVGEIERKIHDPILAEELKKFWQQLLISHSKFSASGLCVVDRNILTSFSSAIATYLVILIQFQKTNG